MRIRTVSSKSATHYAIIYDVTINNKRTTRIYENLGTLDTIKERALDQDPLEWVKQYVYELNEEIKKNNLPVIIKKHPNKRIEKDKQQVFNGGYLFLQNIYHSLGIHNICNDIQNKYQFKYDLNSILSRLIYSRILFPASKLKTLDLSKNFIEQPTFKYQHILRGLEIINKENDFIQTELYKNSLKYSKRNDKVLFYDCTNFYFEIEQDDDFRKYGKSKENRPNPIVGMGLFLDGDGIPLAFSIFPGNTNEQITLKPLEKKIINDFKHSKFIVCTDAGLASSSNRKFNNTNERRFVTTQSLKKLKGFLKDWALDLSKGWKLPKSNKTYDISTLRSDEVLINQFKDKTFYKERWLKEDGLEQRLIVTFSPKYQEYQKNIREKQINRALSIIEKNPQKLKSNNENDPKRFIETVATTINGETATKNHYLLNEEKINNEMLYDGLYAVCTNLEDPVEDIININKQRWEIEESFKIMKSEFNARPIFLSREDRIKAHFTVCFLSLIIYRYLEKKIGQSYTTSKLINELRNYNFKNENDIGYSPSYKRTDLTDLLHEKFNFNTDYEIIENKKMRKIIKESKF